MKTRTKWFLGVLAGAVVIGPIAAGENGAGVVKGLMIIGLIWLAWRVFVFISLLLKPVKDKIAPQVNAFNNHVDSSLRRSGLGSIADAGAKIDRGISEAVSATQKGIDERSGFQNIPVSNVQPSPETHVKCPDCRELIYADAKICRFCRCTLKPQT